MKCKIVIPASIWNRLNKHLFQNNLEQAAFLFAQHSIEGNLLKMQVQDIYLIPSEGWDYQMNIYLEMKNEERARVMKMARDSRLSLIECHAHCHSGRNVCFSPSDLKELINFSQYVKWKLDGKPYAALVFGKSSVDGRYWYNNFDKMLIVDEVFIEGKSPKLFIPTPITKNLLAISKRYKYL